MQPMLSPNARLTKLGRGHLLYSPFNTSTGAFTNDFYDVGVTRHVQFDMQSKVESLYSTLDATSALYDEGLTQLDATLDIEGNEFSPKVLAMIYGGAATTSVQTSGTATAETLTTNLALGAQYQVAKRSITAFTDLKIGATTLVQGTLATLNGGAVDYAVVDTVMGWVQISQVPVTGAVVAGATVTADYTYPSLTTDAVGMGSVGLLTGQFRFRPLNARGVNQEAYFWNCVIEPQSGFSLIDDKYASWKVKVKVLNDFLSGGTYGGTSNFPFGEIRFQTTT